MRRKAQVKGLVSYNAEDGKRLQVPRGPVELEDKLSGDAILRWKDVATGQPKEAELTATEVTQYERDGALQYEDKS